MAAVIIIGILVFIYIELAVGIGYYMYRIVTKKQDNEVNDQEKKQIVKYSVISGVAFPVTVAILIAGKIAEKR